MSVDWSELPPELIESVSKNLKIHKDYIRFRAVCSNWRNSTPKTPKHHLPSQLPWLIMFSHTNPQPFFTLSDNKTHRLPLPEASKFRRRCGSSHGWLVFLEETPSVFAINPLTRAKHHLPPLSSFPNVSGFSFYDVGREYTLTTSQGDVYSCNLKQMRDLFVKKVVFSSSPSDDEEYYAVAILNHSGDLAYCKKGDGVWRFIDDAQSYCEDVVFHKGCFYAVSKYGTIAVCDIGKDLPNVCFVDTTTMPLQVGGDMQYLVGLGDDDDLLLVTRYLELGFDGYQHQLDVCYKTTEFRVFRLNGSTWERVYKLGEWGVFVGENSSVAFRSCDFEGCKGGNRIYFTDDYSESNYDGANGDYDLGVYDLEDGSVVALPSCPRKFYDGRRWPPPIWITPSLH